MVASKRNIIAAVSLSFATLIALSTLLQSRPALGQGIEQQKPASSQAALPSPSDDLLAKLEAIYKDIHANPELGMQEQRTAMLAAAGAWLIPHGVK